MKLWGWELEIGGMHRARGAAQGGGKQGALVPPQACYAQLLVGVRARGGARWNWPGTQLSELTIRGAGKLGANLYVQPEATVF